MPFPVHSISGLGSFSHLPELAGCATTSFLRELALAAAMFASNILH